jgi:hypothetical protein
MYKYKSDILISEFSDKDWSDILSILYKPMVCRIRLLLSILVLSTVGAMIFFNQKINLIFVLCEIILILLIFIFPRITNLKIQNEISRYPHQIVNMLPNLNDKLNEIRTGIDFKDYTFLDSRYNQTIETEYYFILVEIRKGNLKNISKYFYYNVIIKSKVNLSKIGDIDLLREILKLQSNSYYNKINNLRG